MHWSWEQIERALMDLATDDLSRLAAAHLIAGLRQDLGGLSAKAQLQEVLSTAALIGARVLATSPRPQVGSSGLSLSSS